MLLRTLLTTGQARILLIKVIFRSFDEEESKGGASERIFLAGKWSVFRRDSL
jgi:hypothetical protein